MVKKGRTPFFVISIYGYAKTSSSWNDLTQFFFSFFLILLCAQLRTSFFLQCFTCFSVFRRVDKIIARNNDTTIWKNRRSSFAYPWAIVKTIRVHYETYIYIEEIGKSRIVFSGSVRKYFPEFYHRSVPMNENVNFLSLYVIHMTTEKVLGRLCIIFNKM